MGVVRQRKMVTKEPPASIYLVQNKTENSTVIAASLQFGCSQIVVYHAVRDVFNVVITGHFGSCYFLGAVMLLKKTWFAYVVSLPQNLWRFVQLPRTLYLPCVLSKLSLQNIGSTIYKIFGILSVIRIYGLLLILAFHYCHKSGCGNARTFYIRNASGFSRIYLKHLGNIHIGIITTKGSDTQDLPGEPILNEGECLRERIWGDKVQNNQTLALKSTKSNAKVIQYESRIS